MKEAKDTMMGDEERIEVLRKVRGKTGYDIRTAFLQAQAEISFKAGIREVTEWIGADRYEVNQEACSLGNIPVFLIHKESWQAKLKEWGLD